MERLELARRGRKCGDEVVARKRATTELRREHAIAGQGSVNFTILNVRSE